ncbi:MAG: hypothetical protein EAZ60_08800 [Oscillatoriales cyanobacterium]|nr:MAG: hypothetical protein EAZ83_01910 [Oscillatoriales cyanobacterium]TAE94543.1 MAG: hypothetical protein EAZ79_22845 [Oscillatoriales cyanobacterium]TAF23441.1 MAG: hypothetical protein EAZ73_02250 [Oscillatoriales cyanobacterium]TAF30409.1 MAG: hypothetical protein EAZ69_22295 [Oscillatoriales cyanobacterium]TAF56813.1 MAG: hypothetical protein EAZ60_08800 [Oscillatoriales cyanobacterium]
MPPITDEMKSEIAEIDFNVANLILKFQGNYRALSELAETLADSLNSCKMNLHSIGIIPDGEVPPRAIGLTDLPRTEKQIIVSTAMTSTVAIEMLADIFDLDFPDAATLIRHKSQNQFGEMSLEKIEQFLEQLTEAAREKPSDHIFIAEIET